MTEKNQSTVAKKVFMVGSVVRPVIFCLVSGKELCVQQLGQGEEEEEEEAATEEEEEEREDARPEKD